jgi:sortase A
MLKPASLVELGAWSLAILSFLALLTFRVEAYAARRAGFQVGAQASDPAYAKSTTSSESSSAVSQRTDDQLHKVIGRLEIVEIGLTVPVFDNYDPDSLRQGVGHIHGTAMPGGLGNLALAGHRDTFFRPLRGIRKGMSMAIFSNEGRFNYVVDSTAIVSPEAVSVLDIHDVPEMTLITCYPFDFIGAAPKRFIVRGHLLLIGPATIGRTP